MNMHVGYNSLSIYWAGHLCYAYRNCDLIYNYYVQLYMSSRKICIVLLFYFFKYEDFG